MVIFKIWIDIKKQVQPLSTNNTPDDDPVRVETYVFKILMYTIYICIFL
jgi:hypothetical protein